jgi:hypothetical protein
MLSTIDGDKGAKIPHQIFMDEELGPIKDPSRTPDHIGSRCTQTVSNQHLAPEV